jgi:hypothetical protein
MLLESLLPYYSDVVMQVGGLISMVLFHSFNLDVQKKNVPNVELKRLKLMFPI